MVLVSKKTRKLTTLLLKMRFMNNNSLIHPREQTFLTLGFGARFHKLHSRFPASWQAKIHQHGDENENYAMSQALRHDSIPLQCLVEKNATEELRSRPQSKLIQI